jgi:hypothetical protein
MDREQQDEVYARARQDLAFAHRLAFDVLAKYAIWLNAWETQFLVSLRSMKRQLSVKQAQHLVYALKNATTRKRPAMCSCWPKGTLP